MNAPPSPQFPQLPSEVVETVRKAFATANRAVTRTMSDSPNIHEPHLDLAMMSSLDRFNAPYQPVPGYIVHIQTYSLANYPLYRSWEVADIGVLITFRIRGRVVRTKVALLQSKRLYPKEVEHLPAQDRLRQRIGFSSLLREDEDYDADVTPRVFTWDQTARYQAVKKADEQETAILEFEKASPVPVFYLLYHPYRLGLRVSVPKQPGEAEKNRRGGYRLGARVVTSAEMRQAYSGLPNGRSPTAQLLKLARPAYQGDDALGMRVEDFVADRLLGCLDGYIANGPDDNALRRVLVERNAPIAFAFSVTVDTPG